MGLITGYFNGHTPDKYNFTWLDDRRSVAKICTNESSVVVKRSDPKRLCLPKEQPRKEHIEIAIKLLENEHECQQAAKGKQVPKTQGFWVSREEQPIAYFRMSYVEGICLNSTMPMTETTAFRLLKETGEAIQHVHDSGVYHHDIKPDNLVVPNKGPVKILDFGSAKLAGKTYEGTCAAVFDQITTEFAAPEQMVHAPCKETDAYQFGATIYSLLAAGISGKQPNAITINKTVQGRMIKDERKLVDFFRFIREKGLVRLDTILSEALSAYPSRRPSIKRMIGVLADYEAKYAKNDYTLFKR